MLAPSKAVPDDGMPADKCGLAPRLRPQIVALTAYLSRLPGRQENARTSSSVSRASCVLGLLHLSHKFPHPLQQAF